MRTAFWILGVIGAVCLIGIAVGGRAMRWQSADASTQVRIEYGAVDVWLCEPGDFGAFSPGFSANPWSKWRLEWRAVFRWRQRLFVPIAAPLPNTPPKTPIRVKQVNGVHVQLPLIWPLALSVLAMVWLRFSPMYRRARWRARGCCESCGYDLRGLTSAQCPECGKPIARGGAAGSVPSP